LLRISQTDAATAGTKLLLEGKLIGPWVEELRLLCEPMVLSGESVEIDCAGIDFTDRDGLALLRGLQTRRAVLVNCSPYLQLQLRQDEKPSRDPQRRSRK